MTSVPSGPAHELPILALGYKVTGLSQEARAIFSSSRRTKLTKKMGLVLPNPMLRVVANFVPGWGGPTGSGSSRPTRSRSRG